MSETPKVVAKVTYFVATDKGEKCVREGDEFDVTDPVVQANKQFFKFKPGHEPKKKGE